MNDHGQPIFDEFTGVAEPAERVAQTIQFAGDIETKSAGDDLHGSALSRDPRRRFARREGGHRVGRRRRGESENRVDPTGKGPGRTPVGDLLR